MMTKTQRRGLLGGLEAVLLVLYGAPQFILPSYVVQDVELFRFTCSTVVSALAFVTTSNAGVVSFLHCMLHIYTTLCLDDTNPSLASTSVFVARVFSFERMLSTALFPRMSYEARLRHNQIKLEAFFRLHDPSRVAEAETLLLEFLGNESLLFVQLRQKYAPSTAQKKAAATVRYTAAFTVSSPIITHDTTVGHVVLESAKSPLKP